MKIGIITFHNAHKDKRALQLQALQEFLTEQGHEVEFILFQIKHMEKKVVRAVFEDMAFEGEVPEFEFTFTKEYSEYAQLIEADLQYDALIAYGEQLWNPTLTKGVRRPYFLEFANPDALRIAYGVSTGTEAFTSKRVLQVERLLREFDAIAVTDTTSVKALEPLTKKPIEVITVDKKEGILSEQAKEFLTKALANPKNNCYQNYFDSKSVFDCYGCGACQNACPQGAITMREDAEGFIYPIIDETRCKHCDTCKDICIAGKKELKNTIKDTEPVVYAAYHKNVKIQPEGAAGNLYEPMYKAMMRRGGKVVGARYDEQWNVVYDIAATQTECEAFQGAKYVFADSKDVKIRVKKLLEQGTEVLFTGTPCQIAALKSFLGEENPKLITVEILCSGGGSPKVFRKYCQHLETIYRSKLVDFQFRNKFKHTGTPFVFVEFATGACDVEVAKRNNLNKAFTSGIAVRPSCFTCKYIGSKHGVADITIGNYMGIKIEHPEFAHPKGVSNVKINTEQGAKFFEEIKDSLVLLESDYEKAYKHNQMKPKSLTAKRASFMQNLDKYPIDDLLLTYNTEKTGGIEGL